MWILLTVLAYLQSILILDAGICRTVQPTEGIKGESASGEAFYSPVLSPEIRY